MAKISLRRYRSPWEPQDATVVVMIDNNTMLGGHFIRKHHDGNYNHHLKAFSPFLWWVTRLQETRAVLLPYYERWMLPFGAFAHQSTSPTPSLIRGCTAHLMCKGFPKLSYFAPSLLVDLSLLCKAPIFIPLLHQASPSQRQAHLHRKMDLYFLKCSGNYVHSASSPGGKLSSRPCFWLQIFFQYAKCLYLTSPQPGLCG